MIITSTKKKDEDERPRKRRKLSPDDEEDVPAGDAEIEDRIESPKIRRSPTPLATLPSFPLPALPNAPPKSVLALQGLDQALVDAEIIDPATVLPIDSDVDVDPSTGLGEKTKKRLKELGITELFAGEFFTLVIRLFYYSLYTLKFKPFFCLFFFPRVNSRGHCISPMILLAMYARLHPQEVGRH